MSSEPMIETKAECLPRITGPQSVAPLTDIIAPDETRDLRAMVRRRGRVEATRIVVAPLCDSSSTYSYELGALLLPTPTEVTAACVRAVRFGLRGAIGSELFEAAQTGSTYEPAQDGSILAGFRRMLEARRVAVGDQHYHALHRQIVALLADEEELAEASVRPSMVSFAGLLQFLQWNVGLKHPSLSLDRQGHFVAAWQPRGRAKISITFEGVAHAKWIATDRSSPAPARGSGELTMMSAATIDGHFRDWMFA